MALKIKFRKGGVKKLRSYTFGEHNEGSADMKGVLGGKGANLAEMGKLGIPVPSGFTIPCDVSIRYTKAAALPMSLETFKTRLWVALDAGLTYLNAVFEGEPVLLSVRSGARVSMPGMMDTILNVGLTTETLPYWEEKLGERAALDSYRRLIQMYASVAMGMSMEKFECVLEDVKEDEGVTEDTDLTPYALRELISKYLRVIKGYGHTFPNTLEEQLEGAVLAVFKSWNNPRAKHYRQMHGYSEDWGTAVNIQAMVFGNTGPESATGVLFSRCPSTGTPEIVGEFLENAQGEDVVAGIRTPHPLAEMEQWNPEVYAELKGYVARLEEHYGDLQDIEFTVDRGQLYILQTRNGKRGPMAAFRVAHDLAISGRITWEEAVSRVTTDQLMYLMKDRVDPSFTTPAHFTGIAGGGGLVKGVAVFTSDNAVNCKSPCILVRKETSPDDIAGMNAAVGILTATGGLTSHAAVVARGLNKTCVVGCTNLHVTGSYATGDDVPDITEGVTQITMDGETGRVWVGVDVPVITGGLPDEASALLKWAAGSKKGCIRRLGWSLTQPLEDAQKGLTEFPKGTLYVDTAPAEGNGDAYKVEVEKGMEYLRQLLESEDHQYVVDLHCHRDLRPQVDGVMDRIFGYHQPNADKTLIWKAKCMAEWPKELVQRISLKLPETTLPATRKELQKAGYSVAIVVTTVDDLMTAKGPVEVSEEIMKTVFGTTEAYLKLKGLLGLDEDGENGADAQPLYWFEVLEETA